jgi:hypothetical protein
MRIVFSCKSTIRPRRNYYAYVVYALLICFFASSCAVETDRTVYSTSITLDISTVTIPIDPMLVGTSAEDTRTRDFVPVIATLLPNDVTHRIIAWSSSDTKVATVSNNASDGSSIYIKAISSGTAIITATSEDGLCSASCTVTVPTRITWTKRESAPQGYWQSLSSSADGKKLLAVRWGGDIYSSADGGATWIDHTDQGANRWISASVSGDGAKFMVVTDHSSSLFVVSSNSGATWSSETVSGASYLSRAALSMDGSKIAVVSSGDYYGLGNVFTSIDGGSTWTCRSSAGAYKWCSIALSSDASVLAATHFENNDKTSPSGFAVSIDGGLTWIERSYPGTTYCRAVALSADGKKIAACNSRRIYTSSDLGVTWTPRISGFQTMWDIASSADGMTLAVVAGGDGNTGWIYVSTDGGATWFEQEAVGAKVWTDVALSADGKKIAATTYNDYIYTGALP